MHVLTFFVDWSVNAIFSRSLDLARLIFLVKGFGGGGTLVRVDSGSLLARANLNTLRAAMACLRAAGSDNITGASFVWRYLGVVAVSAMAGIKRASMPPL